MARSNNDLPETGETNGELSSSDAWVQAAIARKYGVHGGLPYVGAEGFVVYLRAPTWFASVPAAERPLTFQSRAEFLQNRVAQVAAKADGATRESVQLAVDKAGTESLGTSNIRDKDMVDDEALRRFHAQVADRLNAAIAGNPELQAARSKAGLGATASDKEVEAYGVDKVPAERRNALLTGFREEILNAGTYLVQRKGKAAKIETASLPTVEM